MQYGRKNIQPPELPGGCDALPPPLDAAAEADALWRAQRGDEGAKMLLVEHNLCLVVHTARRFAAHGAPEEELISEGTIGLIKAVRSYDPARCIKLSTYATRCIENEMLMHLRHTARIRYEISLDEPLRKDWDGNELLLGDILGTESDLVYRRMDDKVEKQLLRAALARLPLREQQIMQLRFGLGGGREMTQKEVADVLGISQSYISRLEKRILLRLRKEFLRQTSCA